jgi:predicted nuclease with RNAse H fold
MSNTIWVGADPGGEDNFGVALLSATGAVETRCVSCADEAVALITERPAGAGVDAPLWWSSGPASSRIADEWIRATYRIGGGTVQAANSLRGAALVQGQMFILRLFEKFGPVPVTEAHPKALAIALGGWSAPALIDLGMDAAVHTDEHERDAVLAAIAAREGFSGRWNLDLAERRFASEQDPKRHWLGPLNYFWPA